MRIYIRRGRGGRRRSPSAKQEDDRLVDGTEDVGGLGTHGGHDSRVTVEDPGGPAIASGKLDTQKADVNSSGSHVVAREAAPHGPRRLARMMVLRTQASSVVGKSSN